MKTLGMTLGVVGLLALIIKPGFGLLLLIIGALMFIVGARHAKGAVNDLMFRAPFGMLMIIITA